MGIADRDYTKDLYTLLGIGRHVSTEELRYYYEQAMTAATRSGDLPRARTLLGAYEALSTPRRQQVYGRSFDGSPPAAATGKARQKIVARQRAAAAAPRPPMATAVRSPRPKKWGMSRPIRILFFAVVVPALVFAAVSSHIHPAGGIRVQSGGTQNYFANLIGGSTAPKASDAALYVDRVNGRDDVNCSASGASAGVWHFDCQASDGQAWDVSGSSAAAFSAVVTSPSVYLQSAKADAYASVAAIGQCAQVAGVVPNSFGPARTQAQVECGRELLTFYLRPGDRLDYTRTAANTYRLTVTASDGESVSYDSTTNQYR